MHFNFLCKRKKPFSSIRLHLSWNVLRWLLVRTRLKSQPHANPTVFHYGHYECIRRHGDEVNDKTADDDDDDESSLSLDQWFVVRAIEPADRNIFSTTRMLSTQHSRSFYFVTAILPRDLPSPVNVVIMV